VNNLPARCMAGAMLSTAGGSVGAHEAQPAASFAPAWSFEPWVVGCLLLSLCLYLGGLFRLLPRAAQAGAVLRRHAACFTAGWLMLAIALVSPLDALGSRLFSAHMLQHELMMLVAAPLLVLGRPFGVWIWAMPRRWRLAVAWLTRQPAIALPWRLLTWPLMAWLMHALMLWLWHAPALYEAALHDNTMHTLQHASFLISALLFWWTVIGDGTLRPQRGPAMLYLFTTMVHTGMLGALLTWSPALWYASYGAAVPVLGLSALEDQQLGGLIMWIPGGLAYLIAALALGARWLEADTSSA
jgi:putative membrane protein